jgi:probable HAF family extracellular repeat protein
MVSWRILEWREEHMKTILTSIAAGSLLAALSISQPAPRYKIKDLGTLGGTFNQATFVNNNGLVTGLATLPDSTTQHAVLWYQGRIMDISKPGLGPNSGAFGVNLLGQVEVQAESSTLDPNGEDFCGYFTGLKCLPFVWQNGVLTPLPTLGGNNGGVGQINNRGEVAGFAENSTPDPKCLERPPDLLHASPQVLDYEAVIWGPGKGDKRELRPLPGDTVGMALWINDNGEAVGASGSCANTVPPPFAGGPHAVLWEKDGTPTDLRDLGGKANALLGLGNIALAINNQAQVVGASAALDVHGATTDHAFLWTRATGMRDLGTLPPGDVGSGGVGINDRGEVVGVSLDASGNPRAFLWQDGVMTDLNTIIPAGSPLFLLFATDINFCGVIAGFGVQKRTGDVHGFLATPIHGRAGCESAAPAEQGGTSESGLVVLSDEGRKQLQQRLRFGRFGVALMGPR